MDDRFSFTATLTPVRGIIVAASLVTLAVHHYLPFYERESLLLLWVLVGILCVWRASIRLSLLRDHLRYTRLFMTQQIPYAKIRHIDIKGTLDGDQGVQYWLMLYSDTYTDELTNPFLTISLRPFGESQSVEILKKLIRNAPHAVVGERMTAIRQAGFSYF